jgi:chorismate synthase
MLRILTAGESHGPCLTGIIDGFPAGLEIDIDLIDQDLLRRQGGYGRGDRMKIEQDRVELTAGVLYGKTIGAPIGLQIKNKDWENWKDKWQSQSLPKITSLRPGHADFAGMLKYDLDDVRLVLERASARNTAMQVAIGALMKQLLATFGICLYSYVTQIGPVKMPDHTPSFNFVEKAKQSEVSCPDPVISQAMIEHIDQAKAVGDTCGGIFTIVAENVPVGLGSYSQWDQRLDAQITTTLMGIQAIKGVSIGTAFENAANPGTQVHDAFFLSEEQSIKRETNRAGGIEGGMSNGEPIIAFAAMKPISSTLKPRPSVDMTTKTATQSHYQRSDVTAVPAAAVVGEAMLAIALAKALIDKFGGDSLTDMHRRKGRHV